MACSEICALPGLEIVCAGKVRREFSSGPNLPKLCSKYLFGCDVRDNFVSLRLSCSLFASCLIIHFMEHRNVQESIGCVCHSGC